MGEDPLKNKTKDELIVIIQHLIKENDILKEENESLWFMLEEIQESDKAAKKVMDEQKIIEMLSQMEPVGDA
jgi:regulator of replication initiation timing|tara:strand:- start:533 stop:748 length:216 start_codon:yes stop_codon:yes gene_type:complete